MKHLRPADASSSEQPLTAVTKETDVNTFRISISVKAFIKFLTWVAIGLVLANVLTYVFIHFIDPTENHLTTFLNREFDLNGEGNFPTFFSGLILLLSGILSLFIATTVEKTSKEKKYWFILCFGFVFLSLDEVTQIHEELIDSVKSLMGNVPDFLDSAWIIPYSLVALFFGAYFLRFLFKLPKKTRNLFILSGAIYVISSLAIETAESREYFKDGYSFRLFALETLQESLEMTGVIIFIYALLDYIRSFKSDFLLKFKADK